MSVEVGIHVDTSELNASMQGLKVALENFIATKIWLKDDHGKVLGQSSIQSLAKQNPSVGNVLLACVDMAKALGGELIITEQDEEKPMSALGVCAEPFRRAEGDLFCALPPGHEGAHSWG